MNTDETKITDIRLIGLGLKFLMFLGLALVALVLVTVLALVEWVGRKIL